MNTRAAHRYAKAIMDLAIQTKEAEPVFQDIKNIGETLNNSMELTNVLKNPIIDRKEKLNVLNTIFSKQNHKLTQDFFKLLAENKRLEILPTITTEFSKLYNAKQGIVEALITSALPLDEVILNKVLEKAKQIAPNKTIVLKQNIDENLIGGFILRIDDIQIDTSIAGQLRKIKQKFIEQ